jgi:RNA polymerase sigma-70 factor (ECF subfamily)
MEADGAELEVLRPGIRLMALRALGDAGLADEVAQETIVRAFHALRSVRPERLGSFVAGIARHVITDIIRARPHDVALHHLAPESEPQTSSNALLLLCDDEEKERIRRTLASMTPEDRDLLRLLYFEGISAADIARRAGVPPERIRQRKLRALERLRQAFAEPERLRHDSRPDPTLSQGVSIEAMPARVVE